MHEDPQKCVWCHGMGWAQKMRAMIYHCSVASHVYDIIAIITSPACMGLCIPGMIGKSGNLISFTAASLHEGYRQHLPSTYVAH